MADDDDLIAGKTLAEWAEYNRQADAQLERMKAWGAVLVALVWVPVAALIVYVMVAG